MDEDGGMFMRKGYRLLLAGLILGLRLCGLSLDVRATSRNDCLDSMNVGVSQIVDPTGKAANEDAIRELTEVSEANGAEKETDLVMANVQVAMNVRAEADGESEKVGLLYKDCGGRILERKDGWTRLRSGDLVGWASDDYLLFGEDAETLANEVGNLIVQIETDTLCVRKDPETEAEAVGFIPRDEELEIIEVLDEDWISVDYEGETGYVSSEYVDIDFHIDEGETLIAIQKREEEERQANISLGMKKAEYAAQNFIPEESREAFLEAMESIAKLASAGKADSSGDMNYGVAKARYLGHGSGLVQTTNALGMMQAMDKDAYAEYQKMGQNDDGGLSSLKYLTNWYAGAVKKDPSMVDTYEKQSEEYVEKNVKDRELDATFVDIKTESMAAFLESLKMFQNNNPNFLSSIINRELTSKFWY